MKKAKMTIGLCMKTDFHTKVGVVVHHSTLAIVGPRLETRISPQGWVNPPGETTRFDFRNRGIARSNTLTHSVSKLPDHTGAEGSFWHSDCIAQV